MLRLALALSLFASSASARTTSDYVYTYDQTWRAAVRLIAVDFRFSITERDPEIGYLLFEYREGNRTFPGSVELVRTTGRDGEESVRVVVTVEAMPSYVERVVLDRLGRKLFDEYGSPRRPRPAQPPPQPPQEREEDEPEEDGDEPPRDRT